MGWTANTTVVTVNGSNVVLTAFGEDVVSDGDDHVDAVTIEVSGSEDSHLTVGSKVKIVADC